MKYLNMALFYGIKAADRDFSFLFKLNSRCELNYNREKLDLITYNRLKNLLQYAEKNSLYYKKLFSLHGISAKNFKTIDDIKIFPHFTREILRKELLTIMTMSKKNPNMSATGGTTSSPVQFYINKLSLCKKNGISDAFNEWYGFNYLDKSIFLWGASQDLQGNSSLSWKLRNHIYGKRLMLPSSPLDDQIMENYYHKMNYFKPSYIQAYPTPLYEFCLFLKRKNIKLPYLKSGSVTAEPLLTEKRLLIEDVLKFKIFNWYGSRELGRIASECEFHDGLHVSEPSVYVEIEPDASLPDGYGHLVITDLLNYATPFIRYRTNDIAAFENKICPCGRSLRMLSKIEGRTADVIVLSNGKKVPGVSLTNRVVRDFKDFVELQIIQTNYSHFIVKFVRGCEFSSFSLENFTKLFCQALETEVNIEFVEVEKLIPERSGKIRFVKSEVSKLFDSSL